MESGLRKCSNVIIAVNKKDILLSHGEQTNEFPCGLTYGCQIGFHIEVSYEYHSRMGQTECEEKSN